MSSPKSEATVHTPHTSHPLNRYNTAVKESSKFMRDSNDRLFQMKQIKDNIDINSEYLKNGYYLKKK